MTLLKQIETLIMNRISWNLFLETPYEMCSLILREICGIEANIKLIENVNDWVNFSLNEYFLYKKYNLFQLSLSSVLLGLRMMGMEEQIGKLVQFITSNSLADLPSLQNCVQQMVSIMNQSDEDSLDVEYSQADSTYNNSEESNSISDNELRKNKNSKKKKMQNRATKTNISKYLNKKNKYNKLDATPKIKSIKLRKNRRSKCTDNEINKKKKN